MAPDADANRQRARPVDVATESTSNERVVTLANLGDNEVCIDGIVYDLATFDHPGGESIGVFGGNDVTVQYKMIHPYHTEKHLQKMRRVGKVIDFTTEYTFESEFGKELKAEVFKIVRRGQEFATPGYMFRVAVYLSVYFTLLYQWAVNGSSWQLAILFGVSHATIGLNVQHDANHGAISKKMPWVNNLLGLGADMIGGQKWLWMEQHWTHHAYTNHKEKDPDGFASEPFMIFNDYPLDDPKRKPHHVIQSALYFVLILGYWLSVVVSADFIDLKHSGAKSVGIRMESDYVKKSRKWAILFRLIYLSFVVFSPFYHHGPSGAAVWHVLLMSFSGSLVLAGLFSLSHNFEGADRDPTAEYRKTGEPVCWFKTQAETSSTYGGFISGALTGGLNFQVEHHFFPRMSSAWYPYIAPKVREICTKHGVRYVYYPWIHQNIISTVKYLHEIGTGANWKNKKVD